MPAKIPHQCWVARPQSVKKSRLRHIQRHHYHIPILPGRKIGRKPHPILGIRLHRLYNAHNGNADLLEQIRWIGQNDRFRPHFPPHRPRRLFTHRRLQPQTAGCIRPRFRSGPAAGHQPGMFLKVGQKERAAGYAAQKRRRLHRFGGNRPVRLRAAETLPVPQHKAQPPLRRFLNRRPQPFVIRRPQRPVLRHHLDIQADRVRRRQTVPQPALSQRPRIERARRQRRYRRQHPKPGNRQKNPRRPQPPGNQPEQDAEPVHSPLGKAGLAAIPNSPPPPAAPFPAPADTTLSSQCRPRLCSSYPPPPTGTTRPTAGR